jgi:hypothetical protein
MSSQLKMRLGLILSVAAILLALPNAALARKNECAGRNFIFCDDFRGKTLFKDQKRHADWYRFPADFDNAAEYINLVSSDLLRLEVTSNATANHYSDANISTSEINNNQGKFLFGVNTRAEARYRYSNNIKADASGSAQGSAGFLFWNYFTTPVDPENHQLGLTRDSFGFIWQGADNTPLPGFWITGFAGGQVTGFVPYPNINLNEFHTYAVERRHDSIKYFIDDQLVHTAVINQPGTPSLADSVKLSTDLWVDNARYNLDPQTFTVSINFIDLAASQYTDIDYVKVTQLRN